jgi:ATP-dependent DNA helicase RecQ
VCRALAAPGAATDPDAVTLIVRKALSGVARVHGRFGLKAAVKLIHGDPDPRLERAGLTRVPTFGNLGEHPDAWLLRLLRRCVTAGWASFSGADRPVLVLTEDGRAVMKGERPARLLLPPGGPARPAVAPRPVPRARAGPAGPSAPDATGEELFQALRRERLRLAREEGIAPFIVASDRTLRDIALLRPHTLDELRLAHGIGPQKAERYGAAWLQAVAHAEGPPSGRPP